MPGLPGTISQYTTSGSLVNASLITGVQPGGVIRDLTISEGNLFVASSGLDGAILSGVVGQYTLSGLAVDPVLLTVNGLATAVAVSGLQIFVGTGPGTPEEAGLDVIAEYTIAGELVNPFLITGLTVPLGIAVSGNDLYVAEENFTSGRIGRYTISGEPINPSLINGIIPP